MDEAGAKGDEHSYFKTPPLLDLPPIPDTQIKEIPPTKEPGVTDALDSKPGDLWLFRDPAPFRQPEHKTWATFSKGEATEPKAEFITEARPAIFDAFLAAEDNPLRVPSNGGAFSVVESGVYCACLLSLALGRSSILFSWSDDSACFVATVPRLKISGFSCEALGGITKICQECGDTTRYLRSYVEKTYASHAGPSRIALANAVNSLLFTVQAELGVRAKNVGSPLQLQVLVRPVRSILTYFKDLVEKTTPVRSDEQILSLLFREAQSTEYRDGFLHNAICEVLRMVSRPWIDFVEEWIGLKPEEGFVITKTGPGKGFVKVESRMWIDDQGFELQEPDYFLDEANVPSFMSEDMAEEIFETGRNLRFLRANHPENPLAQQDEVVAANPSRLQWQFDWDSITRVEDKARNYERALLQVIQGRLREKAEAKHSQPSSSTIGQELQFFGQDEAKITERVAASIHMLDQPMTQKPTLGDGLPKVIQQQLFDLQARLDHEPGLAPHWTLLPLLSFGPTVGAQARLVNRECMRVLFTNHRLRDHLQVQRDYHLLGNGLFCSRLTHALFDPELDTAERQSGVALSGGVMGLRLSGRENWPPASSELRLALMGVLADSYEPRRGASHPSNSDARGTELVGDISFAVRDLSPEEVEKCVNPDSLEALDFLRISYKPPSALLPIMTPVILIKYDTIFKLLLRILRMLYVANQLFRDVSARTSRGITVDDTSLRFRIEAHHFVTQLTAYFFETGIGEPWRRFDKWLDHAQEQLTSSSPRFAEAGKGYSPDRLRDYHEQILDEIMLALLLRKRQQPVLKLVEDIFGVILQFAKGSGKRTSGTAEEGEAEEEEAKRLYASFRKKVNVFITVCRGLSEKGGGYGARVGEGQTRESGGGEENTIVRLLLLLDMSGHFTG